MLRYGLHDWLVRNRSTMGVSKSDTSPFFDTGVDRIPFGLSSASSTSSSSSPLSSFELDVPDLPSL
jgi:hypothetical protein